MHGSPVPGYAAPSDTVVPGTRVTLALVGVVRDAAAADRLLEPAADPVPIDVGLTEDLHNLAGVVDLQVPAGTVLASSTPGRTCSDWSDSN